MVSNLPLIACQKLFDSGSCTLDNARDGLDQFSIYMGVIAGYIAPIEYVNSIVYPTASNDSGHQS